MTPNNILGRMLPGTKLKIIENHSNGMKKNGLYKVPSTICMYDDDLLKYMFCIFEFLFFSKEMDAEEL
jgi:hypothetical protein